MLLWRVLVEAAHTGRIDRDRHRARAWVHDHLRELVVRPVDDTGRPLRTTGQVDPEDEQFDWEAEWPRWKENFKALLWLADRRDHPPAAHTGEDRIPKDIADAFDAVLARTRNAVLSDYFSAATLAVQFSGTFNSSERFASLNEFWEVVFVSFFRRDALAHGSVCSDCGAQLEATRKRSKASKAKLCGRCYLRRWREGNQDRQREQWREAARRHRMKVKNRAKRSTNKGDDRHGA
jgi:hypothetical protein